jgi:hypothetical protein
MPHDTSKLLTKPILHITNNLGLLPLLRMCSVRLRPDRSAEYASTKDKSQMPQATCTS